MKNSKSTKNQTPVTAKSLTAIEKTAIRRLAGIVAHAHPTFQNKRTPAERKAIVADVEAARKEFAQYFPQLVEYVNRTRSRKASFAELAGMNRSK